MAIQDNLRKSLIDIIQKEQTAKECDALISELRKGLGKR